MKKILINYYAIIIFGFFVIFNIILNGLKIYGLLYQIIMVLLICLNVIVLVKCRRNIKHQSLVALSYFFICLLSINTLQFLFAVSNVLVLIVLRVMACKLATIIIILMALYLLVLYAPLFIILFSLNDIYEDTHYYCKDNYEVYSYSAGATDKFHFSKGRYYEFLDIDGIIHISYNERFEITEQDYLQYIENHECHLGGEKDGFK